MERLRLVRAALLCAALSLCARCVEGGPLLSTTVRTAASASSGYLDVVTDCGADPFGHVDATSALQGCFDAAYRFGGRSPPGLWPLPLFFPSGIFLISDTLNLTQQNPGRDDGVNVCPGRFLSLGAFGSSASASRPTLRLAPSSPGFGSTTAAYKAVVHIRSAGGEGVDMNNVFKGIDLDLSAAGNPAAAGIVQAGAQGATVTDVTVRATPDTFACFAGLNGAGGEHSNIACEGGRYGVYVDASQPVPVLAGATLINQSVSAIRYLSQESLSLVGVRVLTGQRSTAAAIVSAGGNRGMSIVDTVVECAGAAQVGIQTPATLYMRDVYVRGCGISVDQATAAPLPGPTPSDSWQHIAEWARGTDRGHYFFSDVVYTDGQRSANASVRSVAMSASAPSADLQSRHVWDSRREAGVDSLGVANAKTTCGARGDDVSDDSTALQHCLDTHSAVFLPPGRYRLNRTLLLPAGAALVGMGSSFSFLLAASGGLAGASAANPAPLVRTATGDGRGSPTTIAFLGLLTWQHLAHVYTVDWRSQHPLSLWRSNFDTRECECLWTSAYQRYQPPDLPCALPQNLTIAKAVFRGLGRVHGFVNDDLGSILSVGAGYRALRVADTSAFATPTARLRFYSLNLEHAQSEANAELSNATHVDIYSLKVEGNMPLLWIRADVSNVSLLCLGGGFTAWPLNWTFPPDFAQATPSALRVDSGARDVTLAMLQDHGRAQSAYWPPTGGDCRWGHVYPFPGTAVPHYPFWTYPNVTMWNCWYGVTVSNAYWAMVWSPEWGHTQPGDKPVLWRTSGAARGNESREGAAVVTTGASAE